MHLFKPLYMSNCFREKSWFWNLDYVFSSFQEWAYTMAWRGVRRLSVRLSVNFCANRFFSQANGRIATKLSQDGLQISVHPGCAQGQGQRSRDTRTFLDSWNELLRHWRSGVRFLNATSTNVKSHVFGFSKENVKTYSQTIISHTDVQHKAVQDVFLAEVYALCVCFFLVTCHRRLCKQQRKGTNQ